MALNINVWQIPELFHIFKSPKLQNQIPKHWNFNLLTNLKLLFSLSSGLNHILKLIDHRERDCGDSFIISLCLDFLSKQSSLILQLVPPGLQTPLKQETSKCSSLLCTMPSLLVTYNSSSDTCFQDNSESPSVLQETHILVQQKSGRHSLFSMLSELLDSLLSLDYLRSSHLLLCG